MSLHLRRAARAALLAGGIALTLTGTAHAAVEGTVSKSNGAVRFVSAVNHPAGNQTRVAFSRVGTNIHVYAASFDADTSVAAGPGCTKTGRSTVDCPAAGVTSLFAQGGNGREQLENNVTGPAIPARFEGRGGPDLLASSTGGAADTLLGGDGDDTFWLFFGGRVTTDGQNGTDTTWFSAKPATAPVTITLDGAANDGVAGQGANVKTENVVAPSTAGTTIIGDNGPNTFLTGVGPDKLEGRGGTDALLSGDGNDLVDARHPFDWVNPLNPLLGLAKDVVNCGNGTDRLEADLLNQDPNPVGCETVVRAAV